MSATTLRLIAMAATACSIACTSPGEGGTGPATAPRSPTAPTTPTTPTTPVGKACTAHGDCGAGYCARPEGRCVDCRTTSDCGRESVCDAGRCVAGDACDSDLDCTATGRVCDPWDGVCVSCVTAAECGPDEACRGGSCVASPPCDSSLDCAPLRFVCGDTGTCVECASDRDCLPAEACVDGRCDPWCREREVVCGDGEAFGDGAHDCGACPGAHACLPSGYACAQTIPWSRSVFLEVAVDAGPRWFGLSGYGHVVSGTADGPEIVIVDSGLAGAPELLAAGVGEVVIGTSDGELARLSAEGGAATPLGRLVPAFEYAACVWLTASEPWVVGGCDLDAGATEVLVLDRRAGAVLPWRGRAPAAHGVLIGDVLYWDDGDRVARTTLPGSGVEVLHRGAIRGLVARDGHAYFVADDPSEGAALWVVGPGAAPQILVRTVSGVPGGLWAGSAGLVTGRAFVARFFEPTTGASRLLGTVSDFGDTLGVAGVMRARDGRLVVLSDLGLTLLAP